MYRIIDGRGTGKTHRLMELAKENDGVIICSNPSAMRRKAEAYGIVGLNFMSYNEFMQEGAEQAIYIDELDFFLSNYIDSDIAGYTLTLED